MTMAKVHRFDVLLQAAELAARRAGWRMHEYGCSRSRSCGDVAGDAKSTLARDVPLEGSTDERPSVFPAERAPRGCFVNLNREIACGEDETLFHAARRHGVRVLGACGGRGVCGSCTVRLVGGQALLDGETLVGPARSGVALAA